MNIQLPTTKHSQANDAAPLTLTIADLAPAAGLSDQYDDAIFALCATDFAIDGLTSSTERFCHQLRHAANADTVYVFDRLSLKIIATTSSAGDVDNRDTCDIHEALINMVSDLENCVSAVQFPDIRVFPDQQKMTFAAIPLGHTRERLAIIVDAEKTLKNFNQYYADAVRALYRCHTSSPEQYFAPSARQQQKCVFDNLRRHYSICSKRISERRFELFCEDLQQVDVQFEKIMELDNTGQESVWGWDVIANRCDTDQFPKDLFLTAEAWTEEFRTALDLHLLKKAAFRYKEICEAEDQLHLDDIKPLCLSIYPQTLQQPEYIGTLRELTEKVVTHGARLVFELSEKISLSNDNLVERQSELNEFAKLLKSLRDEFNIRIALDEFGAGNSSLSRLICLEPDIIKMDKSILTSNGDNVLQFIEHFSENSTSRQSAPLEVILETEEPASDTNQSASVRSGFKFHSSLESDEPTAA